MSEVMGAATALVNDEPATTEHFAMVEGKIPDWLKQASSQTRRALRESNATAPPWFEQARRDHPEIVRQLQETYAGHLRDEQQVDQLLARLPSPDVFAEPLLKAAIKQAFGLDLDVRTSYLFHAKRSALDVPLEGPAQDPVVLAQGLLKAATQSLLASALQNFEAWETVAGAMDNGRIARAALFSAYPVVGVAIDGPLIDIAPERFAALCRTLDLGGQYQALIQTTLNAEDVANNVWKNLPDVFQRFEQSAFELQVQIAYLKKAISQETRLALLALAQNTSGERPRCSFLQLWDVTLTGVVVFRLGRETEAGVESIVVYLPDDPHNPLREYDSSVQFLHVLRESLLQPGYLAFFQRFVPARHRSRVFGKLDQAFHPKVWNSQFGWYEPSLDREARLHLRDEAFSAALIPRLCEQKAAVLRDDGLFHAVPTAEQDHKSLMDKLTYFFEKAFDVLNVAAFVVPGLGEVMLGAMAAQLSYEVYEGIESLAQGEKDQAWGYLMDVVDNVALAVALGAVSASGAHGPAVPEAVKPMQPVRLADGSTRLWKPDVRPYAHDIVLPADLKADALGLYAHQGKQWLALDGQTYAVKPEPYRLQHPTRPDAYEPVLRHNQAGAWQHEADRPLEWEGVRLLRRLGVTGAEFSDEQALRILRISGSSESQLRHALVENQRPPALLMDTALRLKLDRESVTAIGESGADSQEIIDARRAWFSTRYQALRASDSAQVIRRAFPGLPVPVAEELLQHADPAELERLRSEQRVPLRMAEEARAYLQNTRLARAYEGLYLESVSNPDSDTLLLHTVEAMPGWSPEVRLEVREGAFHGPLLDSVGPVDAPIRKVLVKQGESYLARDAEGRHLHGSDDFYAALLHALPDLQRAQLGFPHVGQGAELKRAVQAQPLLPRQVLRKALNIQALKPSGKSPMRLADGRLGYPLSGRATFPGFITEDTLLDKIRLLEFRSAYPDEVLAALHAAGLDRAAIDIRLNQLLGEERTLSGSLAGWELASASIADPNPAQFASRQGIGEAIWHHWEVNCLPERGLAAPLLLNGVDLADFPAHLPDFFHERVQGLELNGCALGMIWQEGELPLALFLRRFPRLTSLAVRQGTIRDVYLVQQALEYRLPQLSSLELTDMGTFIAQEQLDFFSRLNLRRLDLSGNQMSYLHAIERVDLDLDYLGLNRMHLGEWPSWLSVDTLSSISELSLRGNEIAMIPDAIVDNQPAEARTRISLQDNPLSVRMIRSLRLSEGADRRFRFDLEVPGYLAQELNRLGQERAALSDVLEQWAEASSSTAPLSAEQSIMRRRIRDHVLAFWRGEPSALNHKVLRLNAIDLGEFPPRLPSFFYEVVYRLELVRPTLTLPQLNEFLRYFPNLDAMALIDHVTPLAELPAVLVELPELRSLSLQSQGLIVDQAAMEFFGRILKLTHLDLDGNTMGVITDVSSLASRIPFLTLSLNNVGLQAWPAWIDTLLPGSIDVLYLEGNQISELPDFLLDNHRSDVGHTDIVLRGNPLSHEVMRRAHTSESYNRPYSFNMDLPEEIRRLAPDRHASDSSSAGEDSDTEVFEHSHGGGQPDVMVSSVDPWLIYGGDDEASRRGTWQQLERGDSARDLLGMVTQLRNTADYRRVITRPELVERVWRVLDAAAQDPELCLILNGMAEEPLRQLENFDTCPDGIRLEFNQMEVQVYIRQSLRDVSEAQRGATLYRLTRRLYRLQVLDDIARRQSGSRDEAEVRLAYRLHWAESLDLPVPPSKMLYQSHAAIRPGEFDDVLVQAHRGETGQGFMDYAAQRDFWVEYLREVHADRFRALRDNFESRVLDLTDLSPGDPPNQFVAKIKVLEEQLAKDERKLIEELTNREGLKYA
ncbi:NEL-type E3 ubiquitin ligase domain-containing protein [Pseudomonas sp. Marseille-P9899]|uniref:NEL-type E3 ubiquitin ligase domain-containing protein n=1 Tax=Pseudomonas sp. Marseille-P9899 TaxID=2730401 RepID=UPI00158DE823|nr:NEL-type E3 ubiquitin ligase domain-containing protein [Pseudomonas sp. Marseille-P9899]